MLWLACDWPLENPATTKGPHVDARIPALAHNLLDYSLSLEPGEKLLIEGETGCEELVRGDYLALAREGPPRSEESIVLVDQVPERGIECSHGTRSAHPSTGWPPEKAGTGREAP